MAEHGPFSSPGTPIATAPPPKRYPYNQWAPDTRALDLIGDKWTLLIIRDLAAGPRRFVELQRVLPGISTEQLRSRLNRMVADELLNRERFREVPPRVEYSLTAKTRELAPVIGALSRWGARWVWSPPTESELIDIGAILRSIPGLQAPPGLTGTVEFAVSIDDGEQSYVMSISDGQSSIREGATGAVAARISGCESAWVVALSPGGDDTALEFSGDRRLAAAFLAAVSPAARATASIA